MQRWTEGPTAMHDLMFRNATIVDGTGAAPRRGDLAVDGATIAAVGPGLAGPAAATIDADGLALAPGIIDGHTHYDAQITWDPFARPSPALGVTTAVIGNCGFTIAPCKPTDRDLVMRNLTQVEGMSLAALQEGIRWEFESFADYMAMLERRGVGLNVAAFFGHSSVRTYVMGADAARRAANDDEIAQMAQLVRAAMAAGAVGFASSTNEPHNGAGGVPMPSRLADRKEFAALLAAMRESGRGVYMLTKGAVTSVADLESLVAETGAPTVVAAMFHASRAPNAVFDQIGAMAAARGRGRPIIPQTSCCPLEMEFTLASPYLFEGLASWKPAMAAAHDRAALAAVYADPGFRRAVGAEIAGMRGGLFNGEWDKVHLVEAATPANAGSEGRPLDALAAEAGKAPLDLMLDIGLAEDLGTTFTAQLLNIDEPAVGRLLQMPEGHIALSDAGAHLTFLCDAGFGLHLLGHWSRDRGVMSLEAAVHRLTGQPAAIFGMADRGTLAPGKAADLMLFDPATVGRGPRYRVHDLPAGASRLNTDARGLHGVWVNGRRIVDADGLIGEAPLAGRVLRRFADAAL
ncbi:MAG: amidohydrolase family protein [Alphaproteobacteria bacterium]